MPAIERPLRDAVAAYSPTLIAEEYPFLIQSKISRIAAELDIAYLQIDMHAAEQVAAGIDHELRKSEACAHGGDFRLSRADDLREESWLNKIEQSIDHGCVLIVCGCLHVHFLAQKAEGRGARVAARIFFPSNLPDGSRIRALSPDELDELLKKQCQAGMAGS